MPIDAIKRINRDFERRNSPFSGEPFPEEELLEEVGGNNKNEDAMLLTAFCTLDYNRDATRLKDNLVALYEDSGLWFAPKTLTYDNQYDYTEEDLSAKMAEIGFRYKNRDAKALWHNYELIAIKYGTIQGLLDHVDDEAFGLVWQLGEDNFMCLKGDKLAPFYARSIHNNIRELDGIHQLNIPVDVHIRRLSRDLFGDDELTDSGIRAAWRGVQEHYDVHPHIIDGALWLIGNRWDEWGEDYWQEVTA